MTALFRLLILVALASTAIAVVMPFKHALVIKLPNDGAAPIGVLIVALLVLVGVPLVLASVVGLLTFRRWARPAAWSATIVSALSAIASSRSIAPPELVADRAKSLLIVAMLAWSSVLLLMHLRPLRDRFVATH